MAMRLTQVEGPQEEPFDLAAAKAWCKVEHEDEDVLIGSLITAVRQLVERELGRGLLPCTWLLELDRFPDEGQIFLKADVMAIEAVQYLDVAGEERVLPAGQYALIGFDTLAVLGAWPTGASRVRVRFKVGAWQQPGAVPESIKLWMRAHLAHFYRHREASTEKALSVLPGLAGLIAEHVRYGRF